MTGAAGNLGQNVARELMKKNARVKALVLKGDKTAAHLPKGIEICEGDVLDTDSLRNDFSTCRKGRKAIVIHMAAIVTTYAEYNPKVYDINVNRYRAILWSCAFKVK